MKLMGLKSSVVGVACAMVVGMGASPAWGQLHSRFVRIVESGADPEDTNWELRPYTVLVLGSTGETVLFPASCGPIGSLEWPLVRAIVIRQGLGPALRNLTITTEMQPPPPPGSRLVSINGDVPFCCTDNNLVPVPCPGSTKTLRLMTGTLIISGHGNLQTGMPLAAVRAVPVGTAEDWTGSDRQIISLGSGATMTCPTGAGDLAGIDLIDHSGVVARLSDGSAEQCNIRFFEDVPAGVVISNIDSDTVMGVTDEYGWAVDADDPNATTEWRLVTATVTGLPNDGQLNSGDMILFVRIVEVDSIPDATEWAGLNFRIVVIGSSSHEPFDMPAGCGSLSGLTGYTHDGVVTRQGPGGPIHLRDNLFFFEPVPPGTIVEMINSDGRVCCVDGEFVPVTCAFAELSFHFSIGFVH